jgi:hypothetical protein
VERITVVGGEKADGTPWRLTESSAIAGIEAGTWALHIDGTEEAAVRVVIATHAGKKYLKAETDGDRPDKLLALPECSDVIAHVLSGTESDSQRSLGR